MGGADFRRLLEAESRVDKGSMGVRFHDWAVAEARELASDPGSGLEEWEARLLVFDVGLRAAVISLATAAGLAEGVRDRLAYLASRLVTMAARPGVITSGPCTAHEHRHGADDPEVEEAADDWLPTLADCAAAQAESIARRLRMCPKRAAVLSARNCLLAAAALFNGADGGSRPGEFLGDAREALSRMGGRLAGGDAPGCG